MFVYCRAGEAGPGEGIVVTMTDPTTIIAKLQSSFENARNAGDLYFFPSTVVTHYDSEIEVIDIIKPGLEHIRLLINEFRLSTRSGSALPCDTNPHLNFRWMQLTMQLSPQEEMEAKSMIPLHLLTILTCMLVISKTRNPRKNL